MLAAYIADPQIGAIADFYMPEMKDRQWQKERMEAFEEACDLAVQKGAELVLLAGSVFAEEYIPDAANHERYMQFYNRVYKKIYRIIYIDRPFKIKKCQYKII